MNADKPFSAGFRFHGELNDFLPYNRKNAEASYRFEGNPSIKDAIEAQGVPHPEVDLIVVNGRSVGFKYHLRDGDNASIYPVYWNIDITPVIRLHQRLHPPLMFILDVHLGKLARLMRLLGIDTLYRNDYDDPEIIMLGVNEQRIILTRDRQLLHAKVISHGYWVRSVNPIEQLKEVIRRFELKQKSPFSRCLVCNGVLKQVEKLEVETSLEPQTREFYDTFYRCTQCGKIYWKGGHFENLVRIVKLFQ